MRKWRIDRGERGKRCRERDNRTIRNVNIGFFRRRERLTRVQLRISHEMSRKEGDTRDTA